MKLQKMFCSVIRDFTEKPVVTGCTLMRICSRREQWYDAGDERFHPDNLIFDARNANILAIISKKTGEIVWQIGPDFSKTKELRKLDGSSASIIST